MKYSEFKEKHNQFVKEKTLTGEQTLDTARGIWFRRKKPPIPIGSKILDLAGSFGYYGAYCRLVRAAKFSYFLVDRNPAYRRTALEYSNYMEVEPPITLKMDLNDPFPATWDNYFDQVWLLGVPPTVKNYSQLLNKVKKCLKSDGLLIIDWHGKVPWSMI